MKAYHSLEHEWTRLKSAARTEYYAYPGTGWALVVEGRRPVVKWTVHRYGSTFETGTCVSVFTAQRAAERALARIRKEWTDA